LTDAFFFQKHFLLIFFVQFGYSAVRTFNEALKLLQLSHKMDTELNTIHEGDAILKYTTLLRVKEGEIAALRTEVARPKEG